MKPKTVMSANMAITTSSEQVTGTSSRKVYFLEESPAVLSTTTDSGGINTINDHTTNSSRATWTASYEHISDDTPSPESEDTKGDGNNTSHHTRSSGNMAISTMEPDNMTTVDIDTGPIDSTHQVYRDKGTTCQASSDGRAKPTSSGGTSGSHRATGEHFTWRRTPKEASPSQSASQHFKDGSNKEQPSCTPTTAGTNVATSSARSRQSAQFARKDKHERHAKPSSPWRYSQHLPYYT